MESSTMPLPQPIEECPTVLLEKKKKKKKAGMLLVHVHTYSTIKPFLNSYLACMSKTPAKMTLVVPASTFYPLPTDRDGKTAEDIYHGELHSLEQANCEFLLMPSMNSYNMCLCFPKCAAF